MSFVNSSGQTIVVQSIPGKVASVNAGANTVTVNVNGGSATTYTVNGDTVYRGLSAVGDLQAGDRVEVQVLQSAPTVAISISRVNANGQAGPGGFGGHGGPRGGQGAPNGQAPRGGA